MTPTRPDLCDVSGNERTQTERMTDQHVSVNFSSDFSSWRCVMASIDPEISVLENL